MTIELKDQILRNKFVDKVRQSLTVDEAEFSSLCSSLVKLSASLKNKPVIDRELALALYCTPMLIRNAFESFPKTGSIPAVAHRLEDCWVELDGLVMNCFITK